MSARSRGKVRPNAVTQKRRDAGAPWALAVIVAAYLALATAYNLATPVGVSPDELGHAEYIRYVAAHHRCPVFGQTGLGYEAHQPPLYYLLAAPVWAAVGTGNSRSSLAAQGAGQLRLTEWRQRPGIWVLSGRAEWQGRAVRLLTTLIGGVGLGLIWALAGVLYPNDRWLPLAVTALAAFLPMRLALAAAISNDLPVEALFTASLLAMALMIQRGYTHRRALALGAALGAALLTKATGALLLPPALITLLFISRRASVGRVTTKLDAGLFFGGCLRTFGIALLLAGPWLLRNRVLYGDFLAVRVFEAFFQRVQTTPEAMMAHLGLTPAGYWSQIVGRWTYSSFWGVFGPFTVWMTPSVYHALAIPTALAPLGVAIHVRRGRQFPNAQRRAIWLILGLCFALVVGGYLRYNMLIVEPQSRFLFPAMAPIALLTTIGWLAFVPRRARPAATLGLTVGMAALAIYAVAGIILPYYH